jgi:hypothetical protein
MARPAALTSCCCCALSRDQGGESVVGRWAPPTAVGGDGGLQERVRPLPCAALLPSLRQDHQQQQQQLLAVTAAAAPAAAAAVGGVALAAYQRRLSRNCMRKGCNT